MLPSNTKVLVVDDMSTMRKIVKRALSQFLLSNVTEATDGENAWKTLQQAANSNAPFELVICDWNMPNLTGFQLLQQLRKDGKLKQTPFIMLTAESDPIEKQEVEKLGVVGYLNKPFAADELKAIIEKIPTNQKTAA